MIWRNKDIQIQFNDIPNWGNVNWRNHPEAGLLFQTEDFFQQDIWNDIDHVDVMTFSSGLEPNAIAFKINRLLVGAGPRIDYKKHGIDVRFVPRLHTKLYIGHVKNKRKTIPRIAFIGSLNLVRPTMIDLMVCIEKTYVLNELFKYYNYVWNNCSKPL